MSPSFGGMASLSTAGFGCLVPLRQLSLAGHVKKTNSGVLQAIIEPSAETSTEETGPGMPSMTQEAFSDFMIASYSAIAPSVRPSTRKPAWL